MTSESADSSSVFPVLGLGTSQNVLRGRLKIVDPQNNNKHSINAVCAINTDDGTKTCLTSLLKFYCVISRLMLCSKLWNFVYAKKIEKSRRVERANKNKRLTCRPLGLFAM